MANHIAWDVYGKFLHEINLVTSCKVVQQVVDIGLYDWLQIGNLISFEGSKNQLAQPSVNLAITFQQAELHNALVIGHVMPVGLPLNASQLLGRRNPDQ